MITFNEARDIVAAYRHRFYQNSDNYQTAPWGWENSTHYHIYDGPWIKLYGNPKSMEYAEALIPDDGNVNIVNKETGKYDRVSGPDGDRRTYSLPDATPVGDWP